MSENSYAPPSLTMGHLSIKLRNLFISIHHVRDKFSILSIYYILILHFFVFFFTLQPNSTKEKYLAH